MLAAKIFIYSVTIAAALFLAFWELKLKRQLTNEALDLPEKVSDLGIVDDLSKRMVRERFLRSLPRQRLGKFRMVVSLKFLLIFLLIIEVILLQKPR